MAWWWVSDISKYLHRRSFYEVEDRISRVRDLALRLFAAASDVPYPSFGLTTLLDFEPFELPDGLAATYCAPDDDPAAVAAAALAVVDLLDDSVRRSGERYGYDVHTPWEAAARKRLSLATT